MSRSTFANIFRFNFLLGALNRDLKLLFLSNLIGAFGDGLYFYIWPLFIRGLGATPAEVGVVFAILGLASALTPIPGGFLADRYDRKKLMILAWLIWIPVPLIFSVAQNWSQLVPGSFLYGCFIGGPASSAYVATLAKKEEMASTFTTLSAAWWFGYIFSPGIGGYIATLFGMRLVFYLSFVLYVLSAVFVLFVRSQHATKPSVQPSSISAPFRKEKLLVWSSFFAVIFFVFALFRPCVPQFLEDVYGLSEFQIGILGSATFAGSTILNVVIGRLGDRWKKSGAVFVSLMLTFISTSILISFADFPILAIASILMGASYTVWSMMSAVTGSLTPEATRGRWMAVAQTASLVAVFPAPYIGGIFYESSPYSPFIAAMIATPLLAALALIISLKEGTKRK